MESMRELFKIGVGPSSSHTMGPQRAALKISEMYPEATHFHVDLHGSLALTGKGHLTDYIIEKTFAPKPVQFSFKSEELPFHPNGMIVHVYKDDVEMKTVEVYSIGGGSILFKGDLAQDPVQVYQQNTMKEILDYVDVHGISLYDYVLENEGEDFDHFLSDILEAMF